MGVFLPYVDLETEIALGFRNAHKEHLVAVLKN